VLAQPARDDVTGLLQITLLRDRHEMFPLS
jgi:hypothetical protein